MTCRHRLLAACWRAHRAASASAMSGGSMALHLWSTLEFTKMNETYSGPNCQRPDLVCFSFLGFRMCHSSLGFIPHIIRAKIKNEKKRKKKRRLWTSFIFIMNKILRAHRKVKSGRLAHAANHHKYSTLLPSKREPFNFANFVYSKYNS